MAISFRTTEEIEKFIAEELKKHPKKKRSQIIRETLDLLISEGNIEEFSKYPPNIICPADHLVYPFEKILESCKGCQIRRVCPLWKPNIMEKKENGKDS